MSCTVHRRNDFRPLAGLLLLLALLGRARAEVVPAAPAYDALTDAKGTLLLGGGGQLPDAVRDHFLKLAGGPKANLVVLPSAESAKTLPDEKQLLEPWLSLKPAAVVVLYAADRKQADDPAFVKPLTEATGVWLADADAASAARQAQRYRGTALERELRRVWQRGGVVGGNSEAVRVIGSRLLVGTAPEQRPGDGFGWVPGLIVATGEPKNGRLESLRRYLVENPGQVGLSVEPGAAAVIQGRRLRAAGDGKVTVHLAPSPRRPALDEALKPRGEADLIALQRAALDRALKVSPLDKPGTPEVPNGTLVIGGGGGLPPEVMKRFLELAGGPDALLVVVPTANDDPVSANPIEARLLRQAGAKNVKVLHTRKRTEADQPEFAAVLKEAKGVWFTGGRQWRFVEAYGGTLTERLFHDVLRRGGVIGGSSAGASIQSEYMPRGHPLGNTVMMAEGYERGFGFLPGVAVDQHFFARKRTQDMTELMKAYPQFLGLGIDEGTVLIVRGSVAEVVGKSKVAVYDRRKPVKEGEKDYEELPAGTRYDLKTRKVLE